MSFSVKQKMLAAKQMNCLLLKSSQDLTLGKAINKSGTLSLPSPNRSDKNSPVSHCQAKYIILS